VQRYRFFSYLCAFKEKKLIRKILHTFFTKIFAALIGFATIVLVSHLLGAQGKGEQSLFLYNSVLLSLVATLIGNSTLIYLTPRHKFSELFFPSVSWIFVSMALLFGVLICFSSIIITYPKELFVVVCFSALTEVNTYVLIGKERVAQANNLKILWQLVSISFLGALAFLGDFSSTYDYVLSLLLGYGLSCLYGIWLLRDEYLHLQVPKWKDYCQMCKLMFSLGAIKQLGSIAQSMNARFSFYLITLYCGSEALGIFSNGISITEAVLMFGSSLALVQYSRLANIDNEGYARHLSLLMTKINIAFTFVALLVLCLLPQSFYTLLFGAQFKDVKAVIELLSIGVLMLSISSTFTQHFASKGNFSITMSASLVGLVITIGLGFWLVPLWGLKGAGITTVASYCVTSLIEYHYFKRWTNTKAKDFLITKADIRLLKSLRKLF